MYIEVQQHNSCLVFDPAPLTFTQFCHQISLCLGYAYKVAATRGITQCAEDHTVSLPYADKPGNGLLGAIFEG